MEYNKTTSDLLGRLNEFFNLNYSSTESKLSENMDLWNNAIGRKYGKKAKSRRELYDSLIKSMNSGEMILDINDIRKYKGDRYIKRLPKNFVIKVQESKSGANIEFYDVRKKLILTKEEFINAIKAGRYPGYSVRRHFDGEYPFSTRDKF